MKTIFNWIVITVVFGLIVLTAFTVSRCAVKSSNEVVSLSATETLAAELDCLPMICQVQRKLNDLGHDIAVDGIVGPETITAWQIEETKRCESVGLFDEQINNP